MSNADIYQSENLGTNAVHYEAHLIAAQMAALLGEPNKKYLERAEAIKAGINKFLWMEEKGYYGQYLYGRAYLNLSPRFEALGSALAILFDIACPEQAISIIERAPLTAYGTTCIYPHIPGIPPYHNNGIWPFVQSFWNLAAGKAGNEAALEHGLASVYRAGALFLTNYENFVAENGDYAGTEITSHRMLWSIAGILAMVHRLFAGLTFEPGGIRFQPVVPKAYAGTKTLSNFKYRDAVLDITVKGYGDEIAKISLDGEPLDNAFFPGALSGKHRIDIEMSNRDFKRNRINLVPNIFSPASPHLRYSKDLLQWDPGPGATSYRIFRNGNLFAEVTGLSLRLDADASGEYKVLAMDSMGLESFTSEPLRIYPDSATEIFEIEDYHPVSSRPCSSFSGNGFVEISAANNRDLSIQLFVASEGEYRIDLRYSNGSGPWNSDNNCAIRSFYLNGAYQGVFVFPQRGTNEWSDWGFSNGVTVNLKTGRNEFRIRFDDWNTNMDGKINTAMLDYLRVVSLNPSPVHRFDFL
jgi:hypothetical protein